MFNVSAQQMSVPNSKSKLHSLFIIQTKSGFCWLKLCHQPLNENYVNNWCPEAGVLNVAAEMRESRCSSILHHRLRDTSIMRRQSVTPVTSPRDNDSSHSLPCVSPGPQSLSSQIVFGRAESLRPSASFDSLGSLYDARWAPRVRPGFVGAKVSKLTDVSKIYHHLLS